MSKKISLLGIQTEPNGNSEANLNEALRIIDEAAALYQRIDVIVLPEYFYAYENRAHIKLYPEEVKEALSLRARRYNTYIVGGTVLNRRNDKEKLYNTSLLFDRNGDVVGQYDKIHLFDVLDCSDEKKESFFCEHGNKLFIYDTDFGKIGIIICYDIRFPELARTLALKGVRFLMVPAAFFSPRFDHWTNLISMTALQNSMYVVGVNLFGRLNEDSVFCGRSLIADPWGVNIALASDKAGFIQAYVDPNYPNKIEKRVGSFLNRRPAVYDIPKEIN